MAFYVFINYNFFLNSFNAAYEKNQSSEKWNPQSAFYKNKSLKQNILEVLLKNV